MSTHSRSRSGHRTPCSRRRLSSASNRQLRDHVQRLVVPVARRIAGTGLGGFADDGRLAVDLALEFPAVVGAGDLDLFVAVLGLFETGYDVSPDVGGAGDFTGVAVECAGEVSLRT